MPLSDYTDRIRDKVRDVNETLTSDSLSTALTDALARYAMDRPRDLAADAMVDASGFVPLPEQWQPGVSGLLDVEYPVGEWPPRYAEVGSYGLYNTPVAPQKIAVRQVAAGATVRLHFTAPHIVDEANDTPPVGHRNAICCYAVYLLLLELAASHSADGSPTINADAVDHHSLADRYRRLAEHYQKRYYTELGIHPMRKAAAFASVDLDRQSSHGHDRITHPGWSR